MTTREVVRKLRAFNQAKPVPRYDTFHTNISDEAYIVAFLRMGGETRPWAVAHGLANGQPKLISVLDGRNREDIEAMMEMFASDFLDHFRVEGYSFDPIDKDTPNSEAPQLWVPSGAHVDMVHYLNYSYWRRRSEDLTEQPTHALARLCGWLFRESSIVGQQSVVDASKLMRDSFVFPIDEVNATHLGAQQAWFAKSGSYREKLSLSNAAAKVGLGITMEPEKEAAIQKLLEQIREASKSGHKSDSWAQSIKEILDEESSRRWFATQQVYKQLLKDDRKVNSGVQILVTDSLLRYVNDFQRLERQLSEADRGPAFTPHPETDHHGSAAASAYFLHSAADSKFLPTLVHEDLELLKESLADGHSVEGKVVSVDVQTDGRKSDVFWTIRLEAADDFRMRAGEYLSPLGSQSHQTKTLSVEFVSETDVEILMQWTKSKTLALKGDSGLTPKSVDWLGKTVIFVPFDSSDFDEMASRSVWSLKDGIGSWLTHSKAQRFPDEKVVDDVVQIEGSE